ncbi:MULTISPECIES: hypothetical protein [unclassified Flavobacterium]|uniref:hypothetical protein n=1 Tax=unclassified Flavobacterium TaxID=196869 RepID=UPI0012914109|nr:MULTISPECIES: hypothetical protein [unclassified Flavobacterium]MQP51783.1 hypothetical protein [Flavobacterium sp. LMO9]MQP61653.1 hypothetical protein [Flavobacterium sp. LMO6]
MKKVVLSLAIVAAMFVSCKENATEETPATDTVVEAPVEEAAPVADTTAVDTTAAAPEAAPEAAPAH